MRGLSSPVIYPDDDLPPRRRKISTYVVRARPSGWWLIDGSSGLPCWSTRKRLRLRFKTRKEAARQGKLLCYGQVKWIEVLVVTKGKERVVWSNPPLLEKLAELAEDSPTR